MLKGWEKSVGATGEFFIARWLKLKLYSSFGPEGYRDWNQMVHHYAIAHATYKE